MFNHHSSFKAYSYKIVLLCFLKFLNKASKAIQVRCSHMSASIRDTSVSAICLHLSVSMCFRVYGDLLATVLPNNELNDQECQRIQMELSSATYY